MKSVYKTFKKGNRKSDDLNSSTSSLRAPPDQEEVPCNKCTNLIVGKVYIVEGQRICARCRESYEATMATKMGQEEEFGEEGFASPNLELAMAEMEEHAESEPEEEEIVPKPMVEKKVVKEVADMEMDLEINFDDLLNLDNLSAELSELDHIQDNNIAEEKAQVANEEKKKEDEQFALKLKQAEKEAAAAALVESLLGGLENEFDNFESNEPQEEEEKKKVVIHVGDGYYDSEDEFSGIQVQDFDDEVLPPVEGEDYLESDEDCALETFFKTGVKPPKIKDPIPQEEEETGLRVDASEYTVEETSVEDLIVLRSKNIKEMKEAQEEENEMDLIEAQNALIKAAKKCNSTEDLTKYKTMKKNQSKEKDEFDLSEFDFLQAV